jgi:hypothetical protein
VVLSKIITGGALPAGGVIAAGGPDLSAIIDLFEQQFLSTYNTRLIGGADEPVYLPANGEFAYHRLFFREDYVSSALHETAHWCIAGLERLKQEDFGYWYNPDGRSPEQQAMFEAAEVKPQALEWIFSIACGQDFRLSVDNLNGDSCAASANFSRAVSEQALDWCQLGRLPSRAAMFIDVLIKVFSRPDVLDARHYRDRDLAP